MLTTILDLIVPNVARASVCTGSVAARYLVVKYIPNRKPKQRGFEDKTKAEKHARAFTVAEAAKANLPASAVRPFAEICKPVAA